MLMDIHFISCRKSPVCGGGGPVQYGSTGPTCAAAALMMPRNERETQKCPFQIFQTILDWAEEHLAPSVEQDFVFSCPFIRMQPQLLSGYLSVGKLGLVPG